MRRNINQRFFDKVLDWINSPNGCWGWTGSRYPDGRPRFSIGTKWFTASRVAYELLVGNIPEGMCVCHKCDNPECTNPEHLFLGTQADNLMDMTTKGRRAKGDKVANKGSKNGFYGKKHSEDTRNKMRKPKIKRFIST